MKNFYLGVENINLLMLTLLLGVILTILIINSYMILSSRDKVLNYYYGYLVISLFFVIWNFGKLNYSGNINSLYVSTSADQLATAIVGTVYLYFFRVAFGLAKAKKFFRYCWYASIAVMYIQIIYLLSKIIGNNTILNEQFWNLFNFSIGITTLLILFHAILLQNKTKFQKIVVLGSVLFYVFVVLSNEQEVDNRKGILTGLNYIFIGLFIEHIFFAIASANRMYTISIESEKLKINYLKLQLETEKVTSFFADTIHQHNNAEDLLLDVTKNLISKLGFQDCIIYLWNDDKTILLQKAGFDQNGTMEIRLNEPVNHISKGQKILYLVAESGKPILINDTTKDNRYFSEDTKLKLSLLCLPILNNTEVIGVINTRHTVKFFYTDQYLQILTAIASKLANQLVLIETNRQKNEKEREVLQLYNDLATSKLTALRAQMNPHFIFNSLNAIQELIVTQKVDEGYKYLSNFSKLLRQVLNNSEKNVVPLSSEIELIKLQLSLEALRFKNSFSYFIEVDENVEIELINLPPLLLQPYVENAIWHGLRNKEGEKKLWIRIKEINEQLVIEIQDNGIGYKKSQEIKTQKLGAVQLESKGLFLSAERIKLLLSQYSAKASVTIQDVSVANNNTTGTLVKIILPINL